MVCVITDWVDICVPLHLMEEPAVGGRGYLKVLSILARFGASCGCQCFYLGFHNVLRNDCCVLLFYFSFSVCVAPCIPKSIPHYMKTFQPMSSNITKKSKYQQVQYQAQTARH